MAWNNATSYTRQTILFRNWPDKTDCSCPACGNGYTSSVKTGVSTIYVHSDFIICEVRTGE